MQHDEIVLLIAGSYPELAVPLSKLWYLQTTRRINNKIGIKMQLLVTLMALPTWAMGQQLLTDLSVISTYWGQLTPYNDNPQNYFGVNVTGIPDYCQIEQAHTLQRHAQRFPTGAYDDGENNVNFATKLMNFTSANSSASFTGPLSFLTRYRYNLGSSYLTNVGAVAEVNAGATFWNRYGRILYNATAGQLAYNSSYPNGTARPIPVLRTTGQSRIENSQINWALGFFGTSFQKTPNPDFVNATSAFDVVIIPEGGTENNTLASYDSCFNDNNYGPGAGGDLGDQILETYLPIYLANATARLQQYAPAGFTFDVNDTYAMQSICAYESAYYGLGGSSFCGLFTLEEWMGFEQTLNLEYYYDYMYGNPTGRAQGIGYLQELIARLTKQYITNSNSSVNSTIDNNAEDFPLDQPFYADFTHDDIILSVLTAASVEYFHTPLSLTDYPPPSNQTFHLGHLTPFGGRLITEVIGCKDPNPTAEPYRVQYYPEEYGYDKNNATYKFIRMRLNNGVLPISTIAGGACDNGRADGLCAMSDFLQSQQMAYEKSNYNYACFANYTVAPASSGIDYDGAITAMTAESA